jgi:hypothetical protein
MPYWSCFHHFVLKNTCNNIAVDVSQGSTGKYTPGRRRCISADAFGGKKYVKGSEKARNTKEEELNKFKKGT